MTMTIQRAVALCLAVGSMCAAADGPRRIPLNGDWKFAADYKDWGEMSGWPDTSYGDGVWDVVTVPHVWSIDPRFPAFVGAGWYRRRFATPEGQHVRLHFEAVFSRARVWLNGQPVGEHEGGYTPFEFDIGPLLKTDGTPNLLVVRADNRWDTKTIPGAGGGREPHQQVKAWWDDGGIIRDVYLLVTDPVYVAAQKIEAEPDLANGTATVKARVWVRNASKREAATTVSAGLWRESEALSLPAQSAPLTLKPGATEAVEFQWTLAREQVKLWNLDAPVLYGCKSSVEGGTGDTATFGIRKFAVRGTGLTLNGQPVKLAGANRIPSHEEWGQNDPVDGAGRDMALMKEGGLVFMRMSHYPVSRAALDWADRHGLLIVEEAVGDTRPEMQEKNRRMYREMIERDWNRPSIVAWSIGNEFDSETPNGVRYVREMRDFVRGQDATRLITFATNRTAAQGKPEEEGSYWVDYVSMNMYSDIEGNAALIDRMHERYPDKPLVVSEFGLRVNFVDDETEREDWFAKMLAEIRKRPFVSGLSVWSFNDYKSRYVGTSANGYREWGLVGPRRELRGSYHLLRREFSGYIVKGAQVKAGVVTVRLQARGDFPVFPPAEAELRMRLTDGQGRVLETRSAKVPPLQPGAVTKIQIPAVPGTSSLRGEIRRNGLRTLTFGPVRPRE